MIDKMVKEYNELLGKIDEIIKDINDDILLSKYLNEIDNIKLTDQKNILLLKLNIYKLRQIYKKLTILQKEIQGDNEVLKVFNITNRKEFIQENLNKLKTASFQVKEEISNRKLKLLNLNKMISSSKKRVISILLFISLMLGGLTILPKEAKKLATSKRYATRRDTYSSDLGYTKTKYDYENYHRDNGEIQIRKYFKFEETEDYTGTIKIRDYVVYNHEFDEVIENVTNIVNNLDKYDESIVIRPLKEVLLEGKNFNDIYEISKIIQDKNDTITIINHGKEILICSLFIFIEFIFYLNMLEINKELLLVSLSKNLVKLLDSMSIKKEITNELEKYEKICYDLYVNDLEFKNQIDNLVEKKVDGSHTKRMKKI